MKRIIKLSLAFMFFAFSPAAIMAQELAAANTPEEGVKKFVTCQIVNSEKGCEIFFIRFEGDINSDKEKRKYLPVTLIKEYKINSVDNSITEIDLSKDNILKTALERISQENDAKKPNIGNVSFILDHGVKPLEISKTDECDLPADLPEGDYPLNVSWDWVPAKREGKKTDAVKISDKRTSFNFVYSPKRDMEIKLKGNPVEKKK